MTHRILTTWSLALVASLPAAAQCPPHVTQTVFETSPAAGEDVGHSVALFGDTLALASLPGIGITGPWSVHLFDLDAGGVWQETAEVSTPGGVAVGDFGIDLALDADTLFVGDATDTSWEGDSEGVAGAWDDGVVHVFERNHGGPDSWAEAQALQPSDPTADSFGRAIAHSNDTLVATAVLVGPALVGAVFVFERTPGGWQEVELILTPTGAAILGDVAIEPGRIVASATDWNSSAGVVLVYEKGGTGTWLEVQRIESPTPTAGTYFGASVALSGDTIAVGELGKWNQKGKAHVFDRAPGGGWTVAQTLQPLGLTNGGRFGNDVALSGDALLVSTEWQAWTPVWIFARDLGGPGNWGEVLQHTGGGNADVLAVEGDRAVIGNPAAQLGGVSVGAAFVYEGLQVELPETYCTAGLSASGCQAAISTAGTPSASAPSGFDLLATQAPGAANGLFFFGTGGRQASPWGNGTSYQCVVPPVSRGALQTSSGTSGACDGAFGYDLAARWTQQPAQNPGAGALVQAQLWFRDPLNTSNQSTSLSDAVEFATCP